MTRSHLRIEAEHGRHRVELNGTDVTGALVALQVAMGGHGSVPDAVLVTRPTMLVDTDVEVTFAAGEMAAARWAAELLRGLPPADVEQAVLDPLGGFAPDEPHGVTAGIIEFCVAHLLSAGGVTEDSGR